MNTASTLTETISKTALLGVERQPVMLPKSDDPLGLAVGGLNAASPDVAILGAAALNALYQQVGKQPPRDPDATVAPCELDDLPTCAPRAEHYLALTLNGEYKDLLPEWLEAVASARQRVSERHLPELLEAGRGRADLRSLIAPVLGKRGRWLAALNRDWDYAQLSLDLFHPDPAASSADAEETWQAAGRAARAAVVTELRGHDPERARALIESTWTQDSADERAAFVSALATNLTLADEPFLEKTLDDRGKDVRRAAADLLSALPGSRLSQRMIERADALITIKRNVIGQASLEVRLPETCDKTMERDGIEQKTHFNYLGEKAWWLTQMLGAIPLDHWTTLWKKTPAQCLLLAVSNEWSEALILGWGKASRSMGNAEWREALARHWIDRKDRSQRPSAYLPSLDSLPMKAEEIILEAMRKNPEPLSDSHPVLPLIQQWQRPWSATFARRVIASIKDRVRMPIEPNMSYWYLTSALPQFARLVPPELADELAADWPEEEKKPNGYSSWTGPVQKFCSTLQIRHDMLNDIRHAKETDTNG